MANKQAPAVALVQAPVVAPVAASKFVAGEVGRFSRSHTRLYMALILDVIHTHNAVVPAGYATMLTACAPHITMFAKYVSVIKPALASKHAATIKEFRATVDGVSDAVKWYENQARLTGHTLSLEDMKEFFRDNLPLKAQAEAVAQANEKERALKLLGVRDDKGDVSQIAKAAQAFDQGAAVARTDDAIGATAARLAIEQASKASREAEQAALPPVAHIVSNIQPLEQGPALNDGWSASTLTVHTKGLVSKVTGLEALTVAQLVDLMKAAESAMANLMETQDA